MLVLLFFHYVLKRFDCTSVPYKKAQEWLNRQLQAIFDWFENPHCRHLKKSVPSKETSDVSISRSGMRINISQTNLDLKNISNSTTRRESLLMDNL